MNIKELNPADLLPHQKPMLLVDRVTASDFENTITVESDIKSDHIFLKGHFPNYPLLPGIVIIEMMFQTCGILNRISTDKMGVAPDKKRIGKAVKIKSATFHREVFPESTIQITAQKTSSLLNFSEYNVTATVEGKKVCTAQLTVSI